MKVSYALLSRYRSVTEAEQLQVAQWLEARAEVTKVEVSELIDANYAF
nr:YggL family protein [Vibrio sp. 10N.286.45.A3]